MLHEKSRSSGFTWFGLSKLAKPALPALIFCFFQLQALTSSAQLVSISGDNLSLESVVSRIKKQTGVRFFYPSSIMQYAIPVNVKVKNSPLKDALETCFRNQPNLEFRIIGKTVVIRVRGGYSDSLANPGGNSIIDNSIPFLHIKGKVVDQLNVAISDVTISVKGTGRYSRTDDDGQFEMENVHADAILEFSAVNMKVVEIGVEGRTSFFCKTGK